MCGITAFFAFTGKSQRAEIIQAMNDVIRHRGPDDEGYYVHFINSRSLSLIGKDSPDSLKPGFENITQYLKQDVQLALGHRRLSIVDLSVLGHQPLAIANDNYWICFNGEVYNHREIRQELIDLGYTFKSKTDTEVIVSAYKEWGKACLDKLNGMFAFIIYDKRQNSAFIARDRFGIKPLYYYRDETGIYFASEIKQFTQLPKWQARLNHQRAHDFLVYGLTDHTSETLFADVWQLRGGEYIDLALNNLAVTTVLKPQRWYDLPEGQYQASYAEACLAFKDKFTESLKLRLRSDVDIGSCLSGGLDSSAIVSAVNAELIGQNSSRKIKTFSACSHYKEFDEKEYIDIVVEKTAAQAYYTYPELNKLLAQNEQITWYQDEPFGSTSIYAQWEVFKLAKEENLKVMLDGQGADEQLCGYKGLYIQTYFNELLRKFKFYTLYKEINLFHEIHGINKKQAWLYALSVYAGPAKKKIKELLAKLPVKLQYRIFGKVLDKTNIISWLNPATLCYSNQDPFRISGINAADVKKTSYSQLMISNLSMLLHWEDRDSMAHSIESRVPFLDYKLVELIYSLPTPYKISKGIMKRVLRDGLDGVLPDEIKNRQTKLGFVTPEEIWLKDNAAVFRERVIDAVNSSQGILVMEEVLAKFEQIISGQSGFEFWIWRVISFGTWMKTFNVKVA